MKTTLSLIAIVCCLSPEAWAGGPKGAVRDPNGSTLNLTWKNCDGPAGLATITDLSPTTLKLGATTSIGGTGKLSKDVTGGTWTMTMTGIGGVNLLSGCSGDASAPKSCKIGLGPVTIGTGKFGGVTFPFKAGPAVKLPNLVSITLPTGLPGFATKTTTTLNVKATDGSLVFCAEIKSAPADARDVASVTPVEDEWTTTTAVASPADDYCLHHIDNEDHKCFEACASSKFASKGITDSGACPSSYNTVDKTQVVEQCSDGTTSLRYCTAPLNPVNVTMKRKGENEIPSPIVGCLPKGKCCLDCRSDCCSFEWHTTLKCGGLHRCD